MTPQDVTEELDRLWRHIEGAGQDLAVGQLFGFASRAAENGSHAGEAAGAYAMAEELQDRDPDSATYGNFRWYQKNDRPRDLNAVEFCVATGIVTWMQCRDRLNDEAGERLERLLRLSAEGIRRHEVLVTYTNIYLKKAWNAIAVGENLDLPDLAEEGYGMFETWFGYTAENGIHEYLSPSYYIVDMDSLEKMAQWAGRPEARRRAGDVLTYLWCDVAANWFAPCDRLGGAHSRDYDYLTGKSTGLHARMREILEEEIAWTAGPSPAAAMRDLLETTPRTVHQSWGDRPEQTASQYVGRRFSIGSSGASRHNMDKVLTVNLAGGPDTPMVSFLMDGRGDPYGINPKQEPDGHRKSRHLLPFLASVQRGPEVLLLASAGPETWEPLKSSAPKSADAARKLQTTGLVFDASGRPERLLSHLALPDEAGVWIGEERLQRTDGPQEVRVGDGQAVSLRLGDVAVGVRVLLALSPSGGAAPVKLVRDAEGIAQGAMRLTCVHAEGEPDGRGTVALWLRCAEGLDEDGFANFRQAVSEPVEVTVDGDRIDVGINGIEGRLRLSANVATGERIAVEGGDPAVQGAVLSVNGRDLAKEILGGG